MAPLPAPTIAHYNGTVQWHHVHSPKLVVTLPPKNSTLQWHSNGTTSSAPCNGTLVPRPIRQSGSSPSPPIGSKNPYSYRYLGNKRLQGVPLANEGLGTTMPLLEDLSRQSPAPSECE